MSSRATRARIGRCVVLGLMLVSLLVVSPAAQATPTFQVVATINVGANPFGTAMAPNGSSLYVANSGNAVTLVNPSTYAIQGTIPVGNFPEDVAFSPNGSQAFVTNDSDATVSVINTTTRTVAQTIDLTSIPMLFPTGVAVSPNGSKVFVTSIGTQEDHSRQNIAVLNNSNPANVTIGSTVTLVGNTGRPAVTPDGSQLVAGHDEGAAAPPGAVFVNTANNQILADINLHEGGVCPGTAITPDGRFRMRISPDGRFAFATDFYLNQVTVISTATNQIIANVPVGANPNDVAFTPDSTKAFVTNQGDTTVSVISISG